MELKMKLFNIQTSIWICILGLCLASCVEEVEVENGSRVDHLPFYNEATFTPQWIEPGDQRLDTFHRISAFKLTNQNGKTISEKTFKNKIYVVDFFFTICPGICPKMTENMGYLQDVFLEDKEVLFMSHSVTPERDSVPVLKQYAEDKGVISDKWHLVTGPVEEIYKLGRKDYFVEEDLGLEKEIDEFLHTENFVLIDKNRHIRGIYNGLNKASLKQLIKDVHTLKQEK